jgi:hypothetical protein
MDRREMARIADEIANGAKLEKGARIVVVITDAEGAFVGVGSNDTVFNAKILLACALQGEDRVDHTLTGDVKVKPS